MSGHAAAMKPLMTSTSVTSCGVSRPRGLRAATRILGAALVVVAAVLAAGAPTGSAHAAPPLVAKDFSNPAIVILGYGLKPSGSMRLILHSRVLAGLAVAQIFPQAPIIVTGGNPRNGNTEAGQMRKMLRLYGVAEDRIIVEDQATSTAQNAALSVPLAEDAGASGIILVTSSSHQGRADGEFADAGGNVLATVSFPDQDPSINVRQFVQDVMSPFVAIR